MVTRWQLQNDKEPTYPFGTVLGENRHVTAFSNGGSRTMKPDSNFSCMEYARRWSISVKNVPFASVDRAEDIWGLQSYEERANDNPPNSAATELLEVWPRGSDHRCRGERRVRHRTKLRRHCAMDRNPRLLALPTCFEVAFGPVSDSVPHNRETDFIFSINQNILRE